MLLLNRVYGFRPKIFPRCCFVAKSTKFLGFIYFWSVFLILRMIIKQLIIRRNFVILLNSWCNSQVVWVKFYLYIAWWLYYSFFGYELLVLLSRLTDNSNQTILLGNWILISVFLIVSTSEIWQALCCKRKLIFISKCVKLLVMDILSCKYKITVLWFALSMLSGRCQFSWVLIWSSSICMFLQNIEKYVITQRT